jgi:hypothetical protein
MQQLFKVGDVGSKSTIVNDKNDIYLSYKKVHSRESLISLHSQVIVNKFTTKISSFDNLLTYIAGCDSVVVVITEDHINISISS